MPIEKPALVVDLDGTLTPTDTLAESVVKLVKQSPSNLVWLALSLPKGKAAFKRFVAANSTFSAATLPYREPLLDYLRNEREGGRRLILATASHETIAEGVSTHLGIFDEVIATDTINLKGTNKLDAIRKAVGEDFVYAGDSAADLPIWESAKAAILVGANDTTSEAVRRVRPVEAEFPRDPVQLRTWAKALRIHQWLKNLLIFVPVLTAFSFLDVGKLVDSAVAFLAFSLAASATYVVNDLWDLDSDRIHPRKRRRPLASADVSIVSALVVSAFCLVAGFALAGMLSTQFLLILVLYLIVTSSYSWVLKQYVLIDVIILSLLYTLRIIAGSVAIGVMTSTWLLAFSVFLFLSLALVKRCAELVALEKAGDVATSGRDYRVTDLTVLWPLGVGAAMSAVVVFGLFISSPETAVRYGTPLALWLVALGLIYWLSRLWIKTGRGEMHDDPVVYAIKDRGSRIVVFFMTATMIAAHYFEITSFQ
ncbi:4-hydroxybenzoate polyprenyltransferase [Allochromatium vinosum]|nr:UbiA family prenyltransferase [Allochromatium vinosum]MBK1653893.1 4-hydroxybenzoate polyprenyltransferase [Allochromatium vinosum]